MKLVTKKNNENAPLCKFGPGGDYVSVWQPEPPESYEKSNCLKKVFTSTIEVAAILLGYKRTNPYIPFKNTSGSAETLFFHKEEMKNASESNRVHHKPHPATISVAQDDSRISAEPMLFPDIGRNGIRIKHQPKHRIRAYKRTSKKRLTVRLTEQGSLFEGQFKSARIA